MTGRTVLTTGQGPSKRDMPLQRHINFQAAVPCFRTFALYAGEVIKHRPPENSCTFVMLEMTGLITYMKELKEAALPAQKPFIITGNLWIQVFPWYMYNGKDKKIIYMKAH